MEADNMEAVDMFQITFISKSQTMFCGRRLWQQEQRPKLVGKPWQWSTCLWLCRVLAAVSAVSTTVSTVAAVAAATVATAPPAAPTSKRSPTRSKYRWTWRMSEPWIEAMTFGAVWKRVDGLESKPHPEHIAFQHLPLHLYLNAL